MVSRHFAPHFRGERRVAWFGLPALLSQWKIEVPRCFHAHLFLNEAFGDALGLLGSRGDLHEQRSTNSATGPVSSPIVFEGHERIAWLLCCFRQRRAAW